MKWSLTILILSVIGCTPKSVGVIESERHRAKVYEVVVSRTRVDVKLDGLIDEPIWAEADVESAFCFPWRSMKAPRTEFRAVSDDEIFYFCFDVEDEDIVFNDETEGEEALIAGDRVELFFASDLKLEEYYCIEMDFMGRKLDYKASFHRKFDNSWDFPGIQLAGRITPEGYAVEGRITLKALDDLGLPDLNSGRLHVGIYRAEFSHREDSTMSESWISWIDPHTRKPDFHIPATFGILRAKR